MVRQVEAVYENGALRLLEPVELKDGERVSVAIGVSPLPSRSGTAVHDIPTRISELETCDPDDRFSGADHDKALYGWEKKS
jgi:predicted DNA-binding antitoxin AbrB/MazE fold protein